MNPGPPRPLSGNGRSTTPMLSTVNLTSGDARNAPNPRTNLECADTYKIIHTNSIDLILKKYNSEEKPMLKSVSFLLVLPSYSFSLYSASLFKESF